MEGNVKSDYGTECVNCGHFSCYHYKDIEGKTRCRWTQSGLTTSGIIGQSFTKTCNCSEFKPKRNPND